jgi:hypothetical protein
MNTQASIPIKVDGNFVGLGGWVLTKSHGIFHSICLQLFGTLFRPWDTDDRHGAVGRMIDGGKRSSRRIPVPVPLRLPRCAYDVTWVGTRPAAVGSRRLTS